MERGNTLLLHLHCDDREGTLVKQYRYPVLAFRQQEKAPTQVTLVAHSGEVLNWAGVPRKSDELLTGYQRFKDDDRINRQIVPFFQDPHNCSPTAIIVALRKDSGLGRCFLEKPIPVGEIVSTTLNIELDEEALESDKVFEAAIKYIDDRITQAGEEDETEETIEELNQLRNHHDTRSICIHKPHMYPARIRARHHA